MLQGKHATVPPPYASISTERQKLISQRNEGSKLYLHDGSWSLKLVLFLEPDKHKNSNMQSQVRQSGII